MTSPKKINLSDETIRQIAARRAHNVSLRDLEVEFGVSRPVINKALATEEAKQTIKDVTYSIVLAERSIAQRGVAELLPMAVDVVKSKLEKGELKAAEMVFKAAGLLQQQEEKQGTQQQAIQVILPGATPEPKKVDVDVTDVSEGI